MFLTGWFGLNNLRPPELICFDHLYGEYRAIKPLVTDEDEKKFVDGLLTKESEMSRKKENDASASVENDITWDDLYYFELILAKYFSFEKLRTRVMRLRHDYRAVAGQREFDEYLASKPPDLQSPPVHSDPPESKEKYESQLREDLKDLLGRMYLEYSILPVREKRLTDLTWLAAKLCLFSLIMLLIILAVLFFIPLGHEIADSKEEGLLAALNVVRSSGNLSSLTVFVVVVTGAMGGFVSALQRIQSPPTEGDSLYNLSLLFHGSKSVFVSPISGSIFAILLYLMFTSGILTGAFFPAIYTPEGKFAKTISRQPENTNNANVSVSEPTPGPDVKQSPALEPSPTPKPVPAQGLNVIDFLAGSGPAGGRDYALLIIWCFIAGFAERFVPDALDRLISQNKSAGTK